MTSVEKTSEEKTATKNIFNVIFRGVFFAAVLSVLMVWIWLNSRFNESLEKEVEGRLKLIAEILLDDLNDSVVSENRNFQVRAMQSFWQLERSGGLLQNFYWLDVSGRQPVFIASFSAQQNYEEVLRPPSAQEAEELVFEFINELDQGQMVFPDPDSFGGASRRIKILLCPLLDQAGVLSSVIGIETDLDFLKRTREFRKYLAEVIAVALLLSMIVAVLLASVLNRRIALLKDGVERIERGEHPEEKLMGLKEFDDLYLAFVRLSTELEKQKQHVQEVFCRKLDELAFTGGAIAHEIRNPLSAIEMHFGLLKRELRKTENLQNSNAVVEIDQQLKHLKELLQSFLDYTRKVTPRIETLPLNEFIKKTVETRRSVLGFFEFDLQISPELMINFDKNMLQQIFNNLVNNSWNATSGKGLKITISAKTKGKTMEIHFSDNGPGVSKKVEDSLFTPFSTSGPDGSGFGLALVRKLVEAHGGEICHLKENENGATFLIEVPQYENSCC